MSIARQINQKVDNFAGLDNVNAPAKSAPGALQTANNVVVTRDKDIRRRDGYSTRLKSGSIHSLYGDDDLCLYCTGANLVRLHSDLSATTVLRSDLTQSKRMAYLSLNNRLYYSNGLENGILDNYTNRSWGLGVPAKPVIASSGGSLISGRYQIVLTYIRDDGQESGASDSSYIDLDDNEGISVSIVASTATDVDYINVYGTSTNGEVFWLIGTVANSGGTFTVQYPTQYSNQPLRTQFLTAPPSGYLIEYYNGRIYIVSGSTIWYTEPFAYELINMAENFMMFPSSVTMINAVQDGLWVATQDETFFLAGDDIPFRKTHKDDAGVIFGTSITMDGVNFGPEKTYAGPVVLWASVKHGFCAGMNSGQLIYMTKKQFVLPSVYSTGSGIVKEEDDGIQYIVSLTT